MTPFRFSFHVHSAHGHEPGHATGPTEHYARPEERFVQGNGPVRILVENGKRLKTPKVIR